MGPKKKGTKKKVGKKTGAKGKGPTIIDGVPVSEMSKDQLEGHVRRLQDELHREREERNYYQLERDRLTVFWEVTKKQLEECRTEARVKDRDLEEAEERHQTEVKVYKQKVKHLLYEQEHNLAELKAENMISLKVSREEHQKTEQLHLNDKKMLQDQLHTKDRQYQEILRNAKLQHSEAVERLRQSFEERAREIEKRYSDRYVTLRGELHLRLKSEVSDTEERKNAQIDSIRKKNERALTDMKNYYNDITLNNLAMISTLKEEIKTKEDRLERNEQLLSSVQQENKKLAEPLKKAREELTDLKRQLGSQEKQKGALVAARAKLKVCDKDIENLKWELEVLQQKYDRAVQERDEIHQEFSSSILDLQQKSGLRYLVLQNKIEAMREELDVKDAQLHEVLSSSEDDDRRGRSQKLLSHTRNVVQDQDLRIQALEREIHMMRQRARWGDDHEVAVGAIDESTSGGETTADSSSSSTSASSSRTITGGGKGTKARRAVAIVEMDTSAGSGASFSRSDD